MEKAKGRDGRSLNIPGASMSADLAHTLSNFPSSLLIELGDAS